MGTGKVAERGFRHTERLDVARQRKLAWVRTRGERVNSKIVEYLRFARDFTRRFPGFESDVHGLVKVKQPDGTIKYMLDCVRED